TIQVKTNRGSRRAWMLSDKAEHLKSPTLFYVFVNLNDSGPATFHVVDSEIVANYIRETHREWLSGRRRDGGERRDSSIRKFRDDEGKYRDAWERLGLAGRER
ncbi:MAG TPA: hypothetical protein VG722_05770, partial [Tepidisphaeraceae bacterium]|nr:hypothetical protein [Tepidisphaeraceae bacterium]